MLLGAHIGIAEGLPEAAQEARRIGCDSIQIFSKSPQMWDGPPIAPEAAAAFRSAVVTEKLRATAVHHGYLLNLATPKAPMLKRARRAFLDEIGRAELLGVDALIFHPGAHVGSGVDAGVTQIAESLAWAIDQVPDGKVRLVLENAAGQGTTIGSKLEELAAILAAVDAPDRLGVALDTCHLFAAGFDFRSDAGYGQLVDDVERVLGCATIRAFHLNDAQAPLGSHLDRHANIGKGEIGLEGFRHVVSDPRWERIPGYLETPLDDRGYDRYAEDLATLRALVGTPGPVAEKPVAGRRARASSSTVK